MIVPINLFVLLYLWEKTSVRPETMSTTPRTTTDVIKHSAKINIGAYFSPSPSWSSTRYIGLPLSVSWGRQASLAQPQYICRDGVVILKYFPAVRFHYTISILPCVSAGVQGGPRALSYYCDMTLSQEFSQWKCSFHWKLRCHWLEFLWQRQVVVVRQGPAGRLFYTFLSDDVSNIIAKTY